MDPLKILVSILLPLWEVIKNWWWLPAPFILWRSFLFLWYWWRNDDFLSKNKKVLIEVNVPKEVVKPIRAMETVLTHLWQILYDAPDSWEKWIEGKSLMSYSFEIASINGEPHFFIRVPEASIDSIEASIYSQYPEAEISVVDDYTKHIPQDIPNEDWDLWGTPYRMLKPPAYPIKTYPKFETEREPLEEKIIDPLAELLEAMAKTGPGEQVWVQITAKPITNEEVPWVTEGEKVRDEIARREIKKPVTKKPLILEAIDMLISGEPPKEEKKEEEKDFLPPEMKLTPGEREVISEVEKKISKPGFQANIRFIYLGKKSSFFKPRLRLALSYFGAFSTADLNAIVPHGQPYITKVPHSWFLPKNILRDRKNYHRKRAIFRKYKMRVSKHFPGPMPGPGKEMILNTEEIATLFHFPGRRSAPAPFMRRIEAKKGEAPSGLPTE